MRIVGSEQLVGEDQEYRFAVEDWGISSWF